MLVLAVALGMIEELPQVGVSETQALVSSGFDLFFEGQKFAGCDLEDGAEFNEAVQFYVQQCYQNGDGYANHRHVTNTVASRVGAGEWAQPLISQAVA